MKDKEHWLTELLTRAFKIFAYTLVIGSIGMLMWKASANIVELTRPKSFHLVFEYIFHMATIILGAAVLSSIIVSTFRFARRKLSKKDKTGIKP